MCACVCVCVCVCACVRVCTRERVAACLSAVQSGCWVAVARCGELWLRRRRSRVGLCTVSLKQSCEASTVVLSSSPLLQSQHMIASHAS